jgi:hypothetical protein
MATSTAEYVHHAQDQALKTLRDGQQAIIDAVRAWAEAFERIAPPTPAMPFGEQLPSAKEVVETSFDFAEQLLKTQREFAERVIAAAEPAFAPKESTSKGSAPKESK